MFRRATPFSFRHHPLLGTMVELRITGTRDPQLAARIDAAAVAEIEHLVSVFSVFDDDSGLQRWKRGAPPSPELSGVPPTVVSSIQSNSGVRIRISMSPSPPA